MFGVALAWHVAAECAMSGRAMLLKDSFELGIQSHSRCTVQRSYESASARLSRKMIILNFLDQDEIHVSCPVVL